MQVKNELLFVVGSFEDEDFDKGIMIEYKNKTFLAKFYNAIRIIRRGRILVAVPQNSLTRMPQTSG
jgi:hypothetical protein